MKILSITAGAAGMYCGSCFRDNALAAELLRQGHDVTLVPVYTPTRTDESNVSQRRVLFGGISVYLQQRSPLFRKLPRVFDRIWDAPAVIRTFARRAARTDPRVLGALTVSMLDGERGPLRKEFDKLTDWIGQESKPDIVNLPNSLLIAMAEPIGRALGRPICCTLQGEELFIEGLPEPYRSEARTRIRRQVRHIDRFVAVSHYCAEFMSGFLEIPKARISVVPLGIRMDGYTRHQPSGDLFRIGYFARVAPEKGLHVLADAYARFRKRAPEARVRLEAAGYLSSADQPYLDDVKRGLARAGLSKEFTYHGEVDREGKLQFLGNLDILSVPATYDEPKGMFLLEAMAQGVPVVQPRRGAFIEIVTKTGGGLLVDPDSPDRLAEAFHMLWRDRARVRSLGEDAWRGVRAHYTIEHSAAEMLRVYQDAIEARPRSMAG